MISEEIIQQAKNALIQKDKETMFKIISESNVVFEKEKLLFIDMVKSLNSSAMKVVPRQLISSYKDKEYLSNSSEKEKNNYISMVRSHEDIVLFYKKGLIDINDHKIYGQLKDPDFVLTLYYGMDTQEEKEKVIKSIQDYYDKITNLGMTYYSVLEKEKISEMNNIFDLENIVFTRREIPGTPQYAYRNILDMIAKTYNYDKKAYQHLEKYKTFHRLKENSYFDSEILTNILVSSNIENKYEKFESYFGELPLNEHTMRSMLANGKIEGNYEFFKKIQLLINKREDVPGNGSRNRLPEYLFSFTVDMLKKERMSESETYSELMQMKSQYNKLYEDYFDSSKNKRNFEYLMSLEKSILSNEIVPAGSVIKARI